MSDIELAQKLYDIWAKLDYKHKRLTSITPWQSFIDRDYFVNWASKSRDELKIVDSTKALYWILYNYVKLTYHHDMLVEFLEEIKQMEDLK